MWKGVDAGVANHDHINSAPSSVGVTLERGKKNTTGKTKQTNIYIPVVHITHLKSTRTPQDKKQKPNNLTHNKRITAKPCTTRNKNRGGPHTKR